MRFGQKLSEELMLESHWFDHIVLISSGEDKADEDNADEDNADEDNADEDIADEDNADGDDNDDEVWLGSREISA